MAKKPPGDLPACEIFGHTPGLAKWTTNTLRAALSVLQNVLEADKVLEEAWTLSGAFQWVGHVQ
jgi:hypothetical protein